MIEPEELAEKTGYSRAPHRPLHAGRQRRGRACSATETAAARAASRASTRAPSRSRAAGRTAVRTPELNYDFWYQPRKNVLISSEFGEPNAYESGFDIEDVGAGRYGQRLHFWDLAERRLEQTLDLGETGLIPLEVRWLHDPEAEEGFVGAALASNMFRFHRSNGAFQAEPVIDVENEELEGWPLPGGVPGLITDLVVSMDDRFLYFSNWLHGDLRQYDVSDPAHPKLTGRLWLGGLLGKESDGGRELNGGPQMLQLSLDGRRLYVTNSLYSTWDNQFYPELRSWLLKVDCDPEGGMAVDRDFFVDFHERPRRTRAGARGAPRGRRLHHRDLPMIAHVGGLPIEETLGSFGPALLTAIGVAAARLRVRLHRDPAAEAHPKLVAEVPRGDVVSAAKEARVMRAPVAGAVLATAALLALAAPAAAPAAVTCDASSGVLTVALGAAEDGAILEVVAGEIRVKQVATPITCSGPGAPPTVTNTAAISVTGNADNQGVLISEAKNFVPGSLPEAGSNEIEIFVNLNDRPGSRLVVSTGNSSGLIVFGTSGINANAVGEAAPADADITGNVEQFGGLGGDGNDELDARGGRGTGSPLREEIILNGGQGTNAPPGRRGLGQAHGR